jgi:magnesium transporter
MAVIRTPINSNGTEWIDVSTPDAAEFTRIGRELGLNPHHLADCLDPEHLPKHEIVDDAHFIITRILLPEAELGTRTIQQMSKKIIFYYNDKFLLTIHRQPQEIIEVCRKTWGEQQRCESPAELALHLIHGVLLSYNATIVKLFSEIELIEDRIFMKHLSKNLIEELYDLKRKTSNTHKLLLMTNEVIQSFKSTGNKLPIYQDVRDLFAKLNVLYGTANEDCGHLMEIYLSLASHKTNEVMRVLTIFSAFFLPLTFIVGVYGMNFEFMPELHHRLGYPIVWIAMFGIILLIFLWFRRKRWM